MIEVTTTEKKYKLTKKEFVRFQLVNELVYIRRIHLLQSDIDLLVFLIIEGQSELNKFCDKVVKDMFPNIKLTEYPIKLQVIRNRIGKLVKINLVNKVNDKKKKIIFNTDIKILLHGNNMLNIKYLSIEAN